MRVQILKPVPLTVHGHRRLYYRNDLVDIADEIAERLIADGRADPVAQDATVDEHGQRADPAFDELTVEQLQQLADDRGVTAEGTGANGKVLKGDLVKALTA